MNVRGTPLILETNTSRATKLIWGCVEGVQTKRIIFLEKGELRNKVEVISTYRWDLPFRNFVRWDWRNSDSGIRWGSSNSPSSAGREGIYSKEGPLISFHFDIELNYSWENIYPKFFENNSDIVRYVKSQLE